MEFHNRIFDRIPDYSAFLDMNITSFNVNGLKAVLKRINLDIRDFLNRVGGDVICLQETKITRTQLSEDLAVPEGYNAVFSFCTVKDGYSGVVTFSKDECTPVAAEEGLTGGLAEGGRECCVGCYPTLEDEVLSGLDKEGRAVLTEYKLLSGERLVIVNVYCPHVEEGKPERMDFKLSFYDVLEKRCRALHEAG
jgi:AP endonuclease-2